MAQLTTQGYIKSTAREIKDELIRLNREFNPHFEEQPADIQNDLLDTAVADCSFYENATAVILNGYSMAYSAEDLFKKQAEEIGLRPKGQYKSQVILKFIGAAGDLIPKDTKISHNIDTSIIFNTAEAVIIDSTGSVNVKAYGETDKVCEVGTIQNLISVLAEGISCTNEAQSTARVEEETYEQFKLRSQARLRSPRMGGKLYAESVLWGIEGVNPRLVNFYNKEKREHYTDPKTTEELFAVTKCIECVVGGGDEYKVAFALYKSFFETQKLISEPSQNNTERKVEVGIYLYEEIIPIVFTRPKYIPLNLKLNITFLDNLIGAPAVKALTQPVIEKYINNLKVGSAITTYGLVEQIMPVLKEAGFGSNSYSNISFNYDLNDYSDRPNPNIPPEYVWQNFDAEGKIQYVYYDCYCELKGFEVEFNV